MKNKKVFLFLGGILCVIPSLISVSQALLLGICYSIFFGNEEKARTNFWGGYLLKLSVTGLGFGINFNTLVSEGKNNFWTTAFFVFSAMILGMLIGRFLKIDTKITLLISAGTAICGGSAIAAVGSVIKADANQISVSTGIVFLLNAIALFCFPIIGDWLGLNQIQFGTWAAIAIHDMSSVVGAASKYGEEALKIASITKMLRVLWIIPLSLILVLGVKENKEHLSRVHRQPNRIYSIDGTHPTIPSQETAGRFFIYIPESDLVRKLTISECYKIMGFPSSFKKQDGILIVALGQY